MTSYAAPTSVRVDQLKLNDLVRVNTFLGGRQEVAIWANVVEIAPSFLDPGTRLSIQLAGGYQLVAEPDKRYDCRVEVDH